jgi:predicted AlkP superfamily phosphohydrolase/phosphomutase
MMNKTGASSRIVVLGLDAFDVDLLQRWSGEGRLPFLTRLLKRGSYARLDSTRNLFGDAPWPSLNAGVSPAKHAFYNHLQLVRGSTHIKRVDAHDCRILPFWSHLRGTGHRLCLLDVPKTFPIEGIDGIQVCAWGEHYPLLPEPLSIPAGAVPEIIRRYGRYPHPREVTRKRPAVLERRVCRMLARNIEQKRRATEELLARDKWDYFMSVFSEVHYAGHELYHHCAPNHWAHDPNAPPDLQAAMPALHTRLDRALESIFRHVRATDTWFIISVHGFETNFTVNHLMPEVLIRLGYAVPAPKVEPVNATGRLLSRLAFLRERIPDPIRAAINHYLVPQSVHDRAHASAYSAALDWPRTRAFMLESDHFQALISVNLRGRESQGAVEPGAAFDRLCKELSRDLRQLENADTGRPLVRDVVRTDTVYQGSNVRELPDLVVQWTEAAVTNRVRHPRFGVVEMPGFSIRRTQHAPDGFLIAGGNRIRTGLRLESARTIDFAPTVLHLLGRPVPAELDGRVLDELLGSGASSRAPAGDRGTLREANT